MTRQTNNLIKDIRTRADQSQANIDHALKIVVEATDGTRNDAQYIEAAMRELRHAQQWAVAIGELVKVLDYFKDHTGEADLCRALKDEAVTLLYRQVDLTNDDLRRWLYEFALSI